MRIETIPKVRTGRSLACFTSCGLIVPLLHEQDAAGIIGELSQVLQRQGCVPDALPFYHAALNQELLSGPARAGDIAFPHARSPGVQRLQFALGRTASAIPWGGKGSRLIRLIFLIAVPATDAAGYLNLLATLARLGHRAEVLEELRVAQGVDAMMRALEKAEE